MARAFCMASLMSEWGKSKVVTLAVDCMGGDHGPSVTWPACQKFLHNHPHVQLLLVGLPQVISEFRHPRASWVAASEVVTMEDSLRLRCAAKKTRPCAWL